MCESPHRAIHPEIPQCGIEGSRPPLGGRLWGDGKMTTATLPVYTKKDFQTDQEIRWCPGCGDYAILAAVQSVFPELGIPREKFGVISRIWLPQPLSLLHELFCLPHHSWPRTRRGHGFESGASRSGSLGG